jgi:outer membrane biosynthesis protein TonB
MKPILLFIGLLLGYISTATAGNGESALAKKMRQHIIYPEHLLIKHIETEVNVTVKIDQDGTVLIQHIQSDSEEMNQSVRSQISTMNFSTYPELIGKTFRYRFIMKIQ